MLFGDVVEALGKDELTALAVCHIEGDITNTRLQYIIDRHKSDITKLLQDLCENGYLVSESKGRRTTYRLNDVHILDSSVSVVSPSNVDSSVSVDSSNDSSVSVDSPYIIDLTENLDSFSVDSYSSVDSINVDSSEGKRYKYDELANMIIKFCALDYKSASEISDAVSKSEKYLKNHILPRMIAEEKLVKLLPDNHPSQKYIAKK